MRVKAINAPTMASKTPIHLKMKEKMEPMPFTTKETKLLTPDLIFAEEV